MKKHMLIFGLGYTSARLAAQLLARGWIVTATRRERDKAALGFDDRAGVEAALKQATHILSSVPPEGSDDPVLREYGSAIAAAPATWISYLSSTGVYGDTGGAWVDETAPVGVGRRTARAQADARWLALAPDRVRNFRLPGIYGPGRSPLERAYAGDLHRIAAPGQVFSRVHVADIVTGITDSMRHGPPGAYNLADDVPAPQAEVNAFAYRLIGKIPPPLMALENAGLSPMARAFYNENRRVANGKAKRLLGWKPQFPDYRAGLRALVASGE